MQNLFFFSLLIFLFSFLLAAKGQTTNVTFIFDGPNKTRCTACPVFYQRTKSYVCSNGNNEPSSPVIQDPSSILYHTWNGGQYSFFDPLPANTLLSTLNVTIQGRFNCNNSTFGAPYFLSLGDQYISQGFFNSTPSGCDCKNCQISVLKKAPSFPLGWPGYRKNGNNTLTLQIQSNIICISSIRLDLQSISN